MFHSFVFWHLICFSLQKVTMVISFIGIWLKVYLGVGTNTFALLFEVSLFHFRFIIQHANHLIICHSLRRCREYDHELWGWLLWWIMNIDTSIIFQPTRQQTHARIVRSSISSLSPLPFSWLDRSHFISITCHHGKLCCAKISFSCCNSTLRSYLLIFWQSTISLYNPLHIRRVLIQYQSIYALILSQTRMSLLRT